MKRNGVVGQAKNQDLVFGLIVPLGADRDPVLSALRQELSKYKYSVNHIKLSDRIPLYVPDTFPQKERLKQLLAHPRYKKSLERKDLLMQAGNEIRKIFSGDAAVALLGLYQIDEHRSSRSEAEQMHTCTAHVIDSLKTPDEVERLRSIYGPSFVAIGIYSPPEVREANLLKERTGQATPEKIAEARRLMQRDEKEADANGQRVRDAFALSDIVVDVSRRKDIRKQIERLIMLLFGHLYLTPTQDEYGMFLAHAAQVRSASMARQVGAAILRNDGSVVSVGTNEVAKPFGGQYWESDDSDYEEGRDFNRSVDSSNSFRHHSVTDILRLLVGPKYLHKALNELRADELFDLLFLGRELPESAVAKIKDGGGDPKDFEPVLKEAFLTGTIDYVRAVHAEMAAITDAGRHGVPLQGHRMYTTTFPCHDCAKHIVASGLVQLVYFEAYPKSLVSVLYDDSIEINKLRPDAEHKVHFHSFVGVAPSRYLDFFEIGNRKRKDDEGQAIPFDPTTAEVVLPPYSPSPKAIRAAEEEALEDIRQAFEPGVTTITTKTDEADVVKATPGPK
jgi:deoxycytidylate deaminase